MDYNYKAYPWGRWLKWVAAALLVIILLAVIGSGYNSLVASDQLVKSRWSQVENVMQARADKINNLVEVVKGYTKHEEKVFGDIAAARSVLANSNDIKSKLDADTQIANATKGLFVLVEAYPDLKASEQFTNLQTAIEGAENRVSVERKRFIEAVEQYNYKVKRFPGNITAKIFGFKAMDYFEADSGANKSPEVKF